MSFIHFLHLTCHLTSDEIILLLGKSKEPVHATQKSLKYYNGHFIDIIDKTYFAVVTLLY